MGADAHGLLVGGEGGHPRANVTVAFTDWFLPSIPRRFCLPAHRRVTHPAPDPPPLPLRLTACVYCLCASPLIAETGRTIGFATGRGSGLPLFCSGSGRHARRLCTLRARCGGRRPPSQVFIRVLADPVLASEASTQTSRVAAALSPSQTTYDRAASHPLLASHPRQDSPPLSPLQISVQYSIPPRFPPPCIQRPPFPHGLPCRRRRHPLRGAIGRFDSPIPSSLPLPFPSRWGARASAYHWPSSRRERSKCGTLVLI